MLYDVGVVNVGEEVGMDEFARGTEEHDQGRGLESLANVLMNGGTIWSLVGVDGCEGVLLVHVARIMRVDQISYGSSFDLMCSSWAR